MKTLHSRVAYSYAKEQSQEPMNLGKRYYIFYDTNTKEWHVLLREEDRPQGSLHKGWYLKGEWNNY